MCVAGLAANQSLRAVYAPIPERDQGKDLVVTVRAGFAYDTNLFGAPPAGSIPVPAGVPEPVDPIESMVWTLAPRVAYNASLTDQTFFSGGYGLTLDHVEKRPGDKLLDSHDLSVRLAHAFSKATTIDVFDVVTIARNPEALVPGAAAIVGGPTLDRSANPDQSFRRNQLDGRFNTPLGPKVGFTAKVRSIAFDYRNARLGRSLDRLENIYGLSADYAVLPELKAVAELRHLDVYYDKEGEAKNKRSDYAMLGLDYEVAKKLTVSSRLGAERRRRVDGERSFPFAEVSGKYDYAPESFVLGGYSHTLEETSDTARFHDSRVNRFFANLQHSITPLIVASGSILYEPSELQGRTRVVGAGLGQPDVDEDTVRGGLALSYLSRKNWMISATYDYDRVWSGEASRKMRRERVGLSANYSF